jgi:hypothetical protein
VEAETRGGRQPLANQRFTYSREVSWVRRRIFSARGTVRRNQQVALCHPLTQIWCHPSTRIGTTHQTRCFSPSIFGATHLIAPPTCVAPKTHSRPNGATDQTAPLNWCHPPNAFAHSIGAIHPVRRPRRCHPPIKQPSHHKKCHPSSPATNAGGTKHPNHFSRGSSCSLLPRLCCWVALIHMVYSNGATHPLPHVWVGGTSRCV